jgi:hypothetical protein
MIRDLLSLLSHEPSEDLEEVMKTFGNISNNKIFPDKDLLKHPAQLLKNSGLFWKKITNVCFKNVGYCYCACICSF